MSSIFSDGALHPGRDPSDAWWYALRRPEEWDGPAAWSTWEATFVDTYLDRGARVVELAPLPFAATAAPSATARDEHGRCYVCDGHRVVVTDPAECRVVAELATPAAAVLVAVGRSRIFVALADHRVALFDRFFRAGPVLALVRPGPIAVVPIALAAQDDFLLVADASWSRVLRFACDGTYLDQLDAADVPSFGWLAGAAHFAPEGTVTVGPFDGGLDDLPWHQIAITAELPAGSSIEVQTFCADDPTAPAMIPWAPEEPVAIRDADGEQLRLVLSDTARWRRVHAGPMRPRTQPLTRLVGVGPAAGSAIARVPASAARALREGDTLLLRGATSERATIASIAPRAIGLFAWGARQPYLAGATLALVERDARDLANAPVIATLLAGEAIDLSPISRDGDAAPVSIPHRIAALLCDGDVLELAAGANRVRLEVDTIDTEDAGLVFVAPVVADQTGSVVAIDATPGRLVVEDASAWPDGLEIGEPLRVDYLTLAGAGATWTTTASWSDPRSSTIWTQTTAPPWRAWTDVSSTIAVRATDRGRYLWLRLTLYGARTSLGEPTATATPRIRMVRAIAPRNSSLRLLPHVFARRDDDDPSGALFVERMLALFDARLTSIEEKFESVARQLDPFAASPDWLRFLGGWFGLAFDPSWDDARRARLVSEAFALFCARGTIAGMSRYIEIYTGHEPVIIEEFQRRPKPGMILGCDRALGCAPLGGIDRAAANASDYAHRFTVYVTANDEAERAVLEPVVRTIVDSTRPAHTLATVVVTTPDARIGIASTIGHDLVISGSPEPAPPLGQHVLGQDTVLPPSPPHAATPLDGESPVVGSFTLR